MWKLHQHLKKDWSLVECDFQGYRCFHGNDIPKILKPVKHEFCTSQICYRKADANFWNNAVWQGKYARTTENCVCLISNNLGNISNHTFCWFRINVENISNHAHCLMKVNRLKEEHIFNKISPKDPKIRIKLYFEAMTVFVGFLIGSRTRIFLYITSIINLAQCLLLSTFSKRILNGSINFLKALTMYVW